MIDSVTVCTIRSRSKEKFKSTEKHNERYRAEGSNDAGERHGNLSSQKPIDSHSDEVLPFLHPMMASGVKNSHKFLSS